MFATFDLFSSLQSSAMAVTFADDFLGGIGGIFVTFEFARGSIAGGTSV